MAAFARDSNQKSDAPDFRPNALRAGDPNKGKPVFQSSSSAVKQRTTNACRPALTMLFDSREGLILMLADK
jgi:hypothetical protein